MQHAHRLAEGARKNDRLKCAISLSASFVRNWRLSSFFVVRISAIVLSKIGFKLFVMCNARVLFRNQYYRNLLVGKREFTNNNNTDLSSNILRASLSPSCFVFARIKSRVNLIHLIEHLI